MQAAVAEASSQPSQGHGCRTVAILSFALEANVFNPVPRRLSDFQVLEGEGYARNERHAGFVAALRRKHPELFIGIDISFVVLYRGFTGGLMPLEDFERMKSSAVEGLRKLPRPPEGVFFDLHGAMGVQGQEAQGDAEGDLVEACRREVGPGCLFSASFDLHGNVSERLLRTLDMVTAYRTMPHIDMEETKEKGLRMLLRALQEGGCPRPVVVFAPVPAIVSGDQVLTTEGEGKDLYALLPQAEALPGVFDASIFVGHQHADELRVRAAVVLTGLPSAVPSMRAEATRLAQRFWDCRARFDYPRDCPLLDWRQCIEQARQLVADSDGAPCLIGDFGDNLSAGATGDVPFAARRLLELFPEPQDDLRMQVLVAGLVDAGAVERCCAAGCGGALEVLRVGAALTTASGCGEDHYGEDARPLDLHDVRVCAVLEPAVGMRWCLVRAGGVAILLQDRAWAFFSKRDFACLPEEFQPERFGIVVLKIGINIVDLARQLGAKRCLLASTPGATTEPLPPRRSLRQPIWTGPSCEFEWTARPDEVLAL